MDASEERWRVFRIECQEAAGGIVTVTFAPKTIRGYGAIVKIERGDVLIAIDFTPPEIFTPEFSEHDYTDKAFEIVRKQYGQQG